MGFFHQITSQRIAQSTARKRATQKRSRPGAHQPTAQTNPAKPRSKPSSISGWLKRLIQR